MLYISFSRQLRTVESVQSFEKDAFWDTWASVFYILLWDVKAEVNQPEPNILFFFHIRWSVRKKHKVIF